MIEPFEYTGYWWLPDENDGRENTAGKITYSPDSGIFLEVYGHLGDRLKELNNRVSYDKILGVSEDGILWTLIGSTNYGMTASYPGIPVITYRIGVAYQGMIHESSEEFLRDVRVSFSGIKYFTKKTVFTVEHSWRDDVIVETAVKFIHHNDEVLYSDDWIKIVLSSGNATVPIGVSEYTNEVRLKQAIVFVFLSEKPV